MSGGFDAENDRALWYAESYGLRQTAGSDAHWQTAFRGGILTERNKISIRIDAR